MKLILPILLLFVACSSKKSDSPKELMKRIYELADAGKYELVKKELYPLTSEHYPLRKYMLEYIKEEDKNHIGDLSYSHEAMTILLANHCDKFTSNFKAPFIKDFYEIAPELKDIPKSQWQFLEVKGVHILAVKVDGRYKLLFWEGLNKLLKNNK